MTVFDRPLTVFEGLATEIWDTIETPWVKRSVSAPPEPRAIPPGSGAAEFHGVFLCANLADSARLAHRLEPKVVAKVLKCFASTVAALIRHRGGKVAGFGGDRVLGAFSGTFQHSDAVRCALNINFMMHEHLRPLFEKRYPQIEASGLAIRHGVGVEAGEALLVRAGAHGDGDMIAAGRAPGVASRLSDLREFPYVTFIGDAVYANMNDATRIAGDTVMWERRSWEHDGERLPVYRSSYFWGH
jgi:class 3 adenylate cyclase